MAKLLVISLCLIAYITGCFCEVTVKKSNGSLSISRIPKPMFKSNLTTKFDGKGLEPWYDVAKSFVHVIQRDDLPYDEIAKIKDGEFSEVREKVLNGWERPYLAVFALGIVFAIIIPIVGFCFCCCRCCGNCGGEMVQKESDNKGCKRATFGVILAIITLLMFTGCVLAFFSNDRIKDTIKSYETIPVKAIRESEKYFRETLHIVDNNIIGTVLRVLDIVLADVQNLPQNMSDSLRNKLDPTVREPLDSVVMLGKNTLRMEVLLKEINSTTRNLKDDFVSLNTSIVNVTAHLSSTCAMPGANCSSNGIDPSVLNLNADYTTLPDVEKSLKEIVKINEQNFSQSAQKGLDLFNDLSSTITDRSSGALAEITNKTEKGRRDFRKTFNDITDKVNEEILNKTDDWVKDIQDVFDDHVERYDEYRYYTGVGLISLVLLPVVMMALGLLCGIFGHDKGSSPSERGSISNIGGNCLMAAVGFMFIFFFFVMLFTSILFMLGAHLEKGCHSVRDESIIRDFVDVPKFWDGKYLLADTFFQNKTLMVKVETVISECRENAAIYKAIQGRLKWDLNETFNVTESIGDIEGELRNFDVDLTDQDILNNNTIDSLNNLANTSVENINFTKFISETSKNLLNHSEIDDLRNKLNQTNIPAFRNISNDIEDIQRRSRRMQLTAQSLKGNVTELEKLGGTLSANANGTLQKARGAESVFGNNVSGIVRTFVDENTKRILGYIDQTTSWAVDTVANDLGGCKILTDVYDSVVNLVCRDTVYPLNGFWFAIGFALLFYVPAIILSVKLAKHYRRMKFDSGFDNQDTRGVEMMQRNTIYPQ
ncbi:prominin-1-like isoform X2 [Xenia sp. Carnegie-2017]|uniref:prominin-1-like isoform X2 n=1 Tax=Xenia sp. Carnegie-2017 TaxID=2897299 RepID=UPI001F049B71|nr:prominin-1-like isoform X2 [Xenia sp. Carnegie-2017]